MNDAPAVPVVIYVGGSPSPHHASPIAAPSPGPVAGANAPFDPYQVAKDFPERWAAYIKACYTSPLDVQKVFNVSERTAYRWWKGEGGAYGHHVSIAVRQHPVEAPQMLFAA